MKKRTLKNIQFCIIAICCLLLFIVIIAIKDSAPIKLGPASVPSASLKGVIQVFMTLFCISEVLLDNKKGKIFSSIVFGLYIVQMAVIILRLRIMSPLPGLVNACLSLSMVILIANALKRIERNSITDDITGLNNRKGFMNALEEMSHHKKHFYVYVLRINNLRSVVDNLGYEYREKLLYEVGKRVAELTEGKGICGRLDGREFAVAIPDTYNATDFAWSLAEYTSKKITLEIRGTATDCYPPTCVGIAEYPKDSEDFSKLITCAGIAMTHVQKKSDYCVQAYDTTLLGDLEQQSKTEKLIKLALENDYFYLNFQPQFSLNPQKLRGFEALLRMKLPDGTMVSPGEFIPVAEGSNLIMDIDSYVLQLAMTEFKRPIENFGSDVILSVNVSAKSMSSVDFVDKVKNILEVTGFPASHLEIEITEYSFAKSMEQTRLNINKLHDLGIMIALDDFGTGYTSLSQLLVLPINLLKIDKSLVDDVETNKTNKDFVNSIIYMGHLMGCEVITEGVEQEAQLKILEELNCDFIQGFIWGRPLPYDNAVELMKTGVK